MKRPLLSLTLLGLLSSVAAAQAPDPTGPQPPTGQPPAVEPPVEKPAEAPVAPQPPAEPPKEVKSESKTGTAGYDKGFFIRSADDKFTLGITGRVQPFYSITRSSTPVTGSDDRIVDYRNSIEVRRARLVLEGNLHGKDLTYKFQSDFGKGLVSLKDFHFDVRLKSDLWFRFGQWKKPFSRQQINSSGRLEVTDRSITDRAFGAGRDVGFAFRNNYEKSPELEWTVGVFSGAGDTPKLTGTTTNDPMTNTGTISGGTLTNVAAKFKPAIVGRVGINRGGLKGYSEADLEGGPLRWGAGASVSLEGDFDDDKKSNQKAEVDYMVKANGFSSTGGFYAMTDEDTAAGSSVTDFETSLIGFHLQAGYMLDKKWQVAGRYALVNDPRTKSITAKDQQEISLGGNFYGYGHDAKFAGAVRFIKTGDTSFTDAVLIELGANVGF